MTTTRLHLLRGFVRWRSGNKVDAAEEYVERVAAQGFDRFYTWTSRRPRRAEELKGGSMYFVQNKETVFRMPIVEVEDRDDEGLWPIALEPKLIRVEPLYVGFIRGWRYLDPLRAPKDLEMGPDAIMRAGEQEFEKMILEQD